MIHKSDDWKMYHCNKLATQRIYKELREMGYHDSIIYRMAQLKNAMEEKSMTKAINIGNDKYPKNRGEYSFKTNDHDQIVCMDICAPDGMTGRVYFKNHPQAQELQTWDWNGDEDKPTLSPSIDLSHHGGWHGFLIDGEFKSA